jgi:hypothetical protein
MPELAKARVAVVEHGQLQRATLHQAFAPARDRGCQDELASTLVGDLAANQLPIWRICVNVLRPSALNSLCGTAALPAPRFRLRSDAAMRRRISSRHRWEHVPPHRAAASWAEAHVSACAAEAEFPDQSRKGPPQALDPVRGRRLRDLLLEIANDKFELPDRAVTGAKLRAKHDLLRYQIL